MYFIFDVEKMKEIAINAIITNICIKGNTKLYACSIYVLLSFRNAIGFVCRKDVFCWTNYMLLNVRQISSVGI